MYDIHVTQQEENNILKIQNEELTTKLRRAEVILSRVKEELAHHRASAGKNPYLNFDEEQRWSDKVKVSVAFSCVRTHMYVREMCG